MNIIAKHTMATSYITDFIQSLSSEEIKIVKEYVYRSNSRQVLGENKLEKLFDTLVSNPEKKYTDKELSGILESNAGAVRVLKSRLFDKAKEALVFDHHFENPLVFNHRERIILTLKKKILLAKSLYRTLNQRRVETLNVLLTETINVSKENEVFDVLIEALIVQKQLKGMRAGISEFERINEKIIFYEHCFKCVQNANDAYYRLILNLEFINSLSSKELDQHIQSSIKKMEFDYRKTKAQEINYYRLFLQIALSENEKKFHRAIVLCKKLLKMIKTSKVVYSKNRIGFAMANLAQFNVFIENFKEAVTIIKKAQAFHIHNSFNYLTLKEQEFFAHFYGSNYKEATNCVEEMLKHSVIDAGQFRKAKFIYFEAYILFANQQFKKVLQLINKSLEFEKDKTGWNIAIRFLNSMVFIELNKINEAIRSISTLRKHIERTIKVKEIKARDMLIFKLLRELEKDNFKRNEKNKTAAKLLAELSDKNKPTAWNYFTPELIPFHEWVMNLPAKG
jgi:hypothetical protein